MRYLKPAKNKRTLKSVPNILRFLKQVEIKREVVHIMIQQVRKPGVRFLSSQKWPTWMTKWCVALLYTLPTPDIFRLGIELGIDSSS